jgi:hypothetical protein
MREKRTNKIKEERNSRDIWYKRKTFSRTLQAIQSDLRLRKVNREE